ncbi:MAG TPA: MAPEG family protein [Gammaproteobacteria bacterium]|nr:MAPEG family protein [Gammaproteobacteria bacterium]
MTTELYWLTLTVLMTGLMWMPYIINRMLEQGIGFAMWDPQGETKTEVTWAERMMRAHANAVENLAIFAPLVLTLHVTGLNNDATALACMAYFFARLVHYIVFSFGIPLMRVLVFMISVVAQVTLALTLLGAF